MVVQGALKGVAAALNAPTMDAKVRMHHTVVSLTRVDHTSFISYMIDMLLSRKKSRGA